MPSPPAPSPLPPSSPLPPLPSPGSPPSPSALDLVATLNHQFEYGHPADDIATNGVLLRQFDDLSAGSMNHDGTGELWKPCPRSAWCGHYHAQWPASIVSTHVRHTYYVSRGGMLLNPHLVDFFCIYNDDGNSMGKTCGGGYGDAHCIPGCSPPGQQCQDVRHSWSCSWPPSHLADCMRAQLQTSDGARPIAQAVRHNEIVIDTRSIEAHLPRVVSGFFFVQDASKARLARSNFIAAYGLEPGQVPLVKMDFSAAGGEADPAFTLVA